MKGEEEAVRREKRGVLLQVVKWEESNLVPSCTNYTINMPLNPLSIWQLTAAHPHT